MVVYLACVHMCARLGPAGEVCKHQEQLRGSQPGSWGETLMYEELSAQKRLVNSLSIKL